MRRLIALALVVALALALTAPAAEARHGHVGVGIGAAVGLALAAPFIIIGSILAPLVHQPPVYAYPPPLVELSVEPGERSVGEDLRAVDIAGGSRLLWFSRHDRIAWLERSEELQQLICGSVPIQIINEDQRH